jgi:hypothetical protein
LWQSYDFTYNFISYPQEIKQLAGRGISGKKWNQSIPVNSFFEQRWSLIELDVLVSMIYKISLDELIQIYSVQFAVDMQNDLETYYDQSGKIVFTNNKSLSSIGVDRSVWNSVKDLKEGETYEHTIEKNELYYGEEVTYHAPFEKCDRVEDYKTVWAHFEKIFNQN